MDPVSESLVVYGPLGLFCVVLIYAVMRLYKANQVLQQDYQKKIDDLMIRHIAKAESWVEKGQELANSLNNVLEAITRQRGDS